MAELLKDKGANVDAVAEPNREVSLEEESKSVLQTSAQSNAEVEGSADYTSPSSEGTSFKEPEQRSKKPIRFNEVVKRRPKRKTSISEAVSLEQVKSVFQTSTFVQIREEVDNNIEQKFLSRFSDKSDLPWFMTDDSAITKMTKGKKTHDRKDAQVHSRLPSVKRKEHIKEQADWRRTQQKNLFLKPELRNEYEREYPSSEHRFAKMSEEEQWAHMSAVQCAYIGKLLRKDFNKKIKKMFENPESTICSNKVPIPDKPKVRTHLKKMTGIKDAQVHSRLPSVKRKEHIKEQADCCCCTRWKELLRNDIKEILREELAVEHAKMRKQIQQEHWNLQYLWLKDLFRRDLKEMVHEEIKKSKMIIGPKEEPLLGSSKGTTDFQRTAPEGKIKKKYKGAHESAPSHSGKPLVETDEESVDGQNDSHCMPLKNLIKEDLKENLGEILEKYKYDTCMKKELPHIFKGRKQLRKISTEQKLKKKYDSKSLYSEQPATKTVKKVEHEHDALQYVHLMEVIKKDLKVGICKVLGKYKTNVCPKEEDLPPVSKKKTRTKVEEKKSEHLYIPHFSSFQHRISALRATAHIEPASAACAGYSGDAAVDQQYFEAIKLISMVKLK